ncbi:MAG: hypothetical protein C3F02_03275 [Parcubacteria group bacterium]|nr:MAG: hypothetical protein C3F02_03275 [Parcubacteria group bacterium]
MPDELHVESMVTDKKYQTFRTVSSVHCQWTINSDLVSRRDLTVVLRQIHGILEAFDTIAVRGQLGVEIFPEGARYRGRLEYHPQDQTEMTQWLNKLLTTIASLHPQFLSHQVRASYALTLTCQVLDK